MKIDKKKYKNLEYYKFKLLILAWCRTSSSEKKIELKLDLRGQHFERIISIYKETSGTQNN